MSYIVAPGDGDWSLRGQHCDGNDVLMSLVYAALFLLARPIFIHFCFRPLGCVMKKLDPTEQPTDKMEQELRKFCKYCWHACCYIYFWGWALSLYLPLPWAFDMDALWAAYPHAPAGKLPFKTLFLVEAGFYLHGFVESIVHDSKRSDFLMIIVHHVLAVALIYGCVWGNAHRLGIVVIVLQDVGDIVMYAGKILHQSVALTFAYTALLHTVMLCVITVTWFITRVVFLGLLVQRGWAYGLDLVPGMDKAFINSAALVPGNPNFDWLSMVLQVLLTFMLLLQVVWFIAILWMCVTQICQGSFHDFVLDPVGKKGKGIASDPAAAGRRTSSPKRKGSSSKKVE